jgi:hypothetical protein
VTFYSYCVEKCEDFSPNFGDKRTGCCITTKQFHTSFFTRELFTKTNMTAVPHPSYSPDFAPCDFSLFPRLSGCHFDTTEVTEAEPQAVLNTLTEHDFQDAF